MSKWRFICITAAGEVHGTDDEDNVQEFLEAGEGGSIALKVSDEGTVQLGDDLSETPIPEL